jgi:predicted adenylyl cyclase CyaB
VPRNVEIKARIDTVESLAPRAAAIATAGPTEIFQDDTFFCCNGGRLKLRAFSDSAGELIFYRRADMPGPKESFYVRSPTSEPNSLREALSLAYGVAGRVVKQRTLFLVGRTRVHLDRVRDLGEFLELEVVLRDDEPTEVGTHEAHELMACLGVDSGQFIEGAYVDLLASLGGDTVDSDREAAWADETRRRPDAWQRGDVTSIPADEFVARLSETVGGKPTT